MPLLVERHACPHACDCSSSHRRTHRGRRRRAGACSASRSRRCRECPSCRETTISGTLPRSARLAPVCRRPCRVVSGRSSVSTSPARCSTRSTSCVGESFAIARPPRPGHTSAVVTLCSSSAAISLRHDRGRNESCEIGGHDPGSLVNSSSAPGERRGLLRLTSGSRARPSAWLGLTLGRLAPISLPHWAAAHYGSPASTRLARPRG